MANNTDNFDPSVPVDAAFDADAFPLPMLTAPTEADEEIYGPVTSFEPIGDRLLLKRIQGKDKSKGGLFVPEGSKEAARPWEGYIVAVGPGRYDNGTFVEMNVEVGDRVAFGQYAGTELIIDEGKYLVMREEDVFGVRR